MRIRYKRAFKLFFCGLFLILFTVTAFSQNMFRKINDFDGDGKADFAITRNSGGYRYWYIRQTTDGVKISYWGVENDDNIVGDFDGDGKYDFGIFRRETTQQPAIMRFSFWVNASQAGQIININPTNSFPQSAAVPQDYNGDGRTELAFTHSSGTLQLGPCCSPVVYTAPLLKLGDLNGDGKADFVEYTSNGTDAILLIRYTPLQPRQTVQFGLSGDEFVAADFDGDGKGDLTVFRPSDGTWWWKRSSDGVIYALTFGTTGDIPVPADYDGDGKTDIAIWRSGEQSYFWVYGSQVGVFVVPWGIASDTVVTY